MTPPVLIRCDGGLIARRAGSEDIASGHLMRMLNFAREWRALGGCVTLVTNRHCIGLAPLLERYAALGCQLAETGASYCDSLEDAGETLALAKHVHARAIYLDGYHFGASYQVAIKEGGLPLLFQDDTATLGPYVADFIVGGHIHAAHLNYDAPHTTRKLLGPEYALLSPEYAQRRSDPRPTPAVATRLLVTFGSSDILRDTQKCLRALRDLPRAADAWLAQLEIVVIVGATNPTLSEINSLATSLTEARDCRVEVLRDVRDMAARMQRADFAFSATGGTVLELMCLGVPIALQIIHPVQVPIAARMVHEQVCVLVGDSQGLDGEANTLMERTIGRALFDLAHDEPLRTSLSGRSRALVDGAGSRRVCAALAAFLEVRKP